MMCAPVIGWSEVKVPQRKQAVDYARCLRELAEVHFAYAERIILVQDNLNTGGFAKGARLVLFRNSAEFSRQLKGRTP
ncbi:MAG: hypothetical protein CMO80_25020 [Verrucomicrobiales bacterium]|nr:hypothetical protein [Verrucomicrobiales bacterium]|tara:strand:+ start:3856 stop:4089 length:234 start_codon:yes stop_codon:yes gene_type:complete